MNTEKQKMLLGEPYFPSNKELQKERMHAKRLCHQLNQLSPDERKQIIRLTKSLFGESPNPWVEPTFYCDYGYNITTGKKLLCQSRCCDPGCSTCHLWR